jgi:hypothetical protein
VKVTIDGREFDVRQKPGHVVIYEKVQPGAAGRGRRMKPLVPGGFYKSRKVWDSRAVVKGMPAPKIDSVIARVLAAASRRKTLILSSETDRG